MRLRKNSGLCLIAIFGGLLCLICLTVAPIAIAQSSSSTLAQGFEIDSSTDDIVPGALVSTQAENPQKVELATISSADRLVGVVDENSLVTISTSDEEVQVVLEGTTSILASDINGAIKIGDKITASPIAGVGMLATADSKIVGTAQADLDTDDGHTQTIRDSQGNSHTVHINYIPIQVDIAFYKAPSSSFLPPFVQSLANNVAGRPVSLIRILVTTVLILTSFIGVAILIYSSVRSAMNSLGRNPLAAKAIRKGLYEVMLVAAIVLASTLLASYLILSI